MARKAPPHFRRLTEVALVIVVGLTGVGKSTILNLMPNFGLTFTLLPNRRKITDAIIITSLQRESGQTTRPLVDRVERFEATARYRARYPGGMAYALSRLAVDPAKAASLLIFDGLRGLNEVQHAANYFSRARFVVLHAPDMVRLNRLLKRGDDFDTTTIHTSLLGKNLMAALMSVPNIEAVFNEEELRQIAKTARAAGLSTDTVVEKAAIIVEERRNYDPDTARVHLIHTLPPERVLVIDTTADSAAAVARQAAEWLGAGS